ncbi:DHH family phosphoesterase [Candidatus Parcubacteria bacterium]|nr:DHH family phosphoesterase [Candidatus Parcubacteria bacterium]
MINPSQIDELVKQSSRIVIIQADNPDGDSLASTLALEAILTDMGKQITMFCGVDIPGYLRYLSGWDRVVNQLPGEFDLSIIVDTSSLLLLESLQNTGQINWLKTRPSLVIDHHSSEPTIDFAKIYNEPKAAACGEVIYQLAKKNKWPVPADAAEFITIAILSDSLGLISESTTSKTINFLAELVESGVSLAKLDSTRKIFQKKQPELLKYKGRLLQRIEYTDDQSIAHITIPWDEIEKYSPLYNPPMLVMDEMRQVEGVRLAIAFKTYPDGRITGKIRANFGFPVADKLAENFGGGGHIYASGFRITDGRDINNVKLNVLKKAGELLSELETVK